MMQLKHGFFDEATISVIASDTVREIGRLAERSLDLRSVGSRSVRPCSSALRLARAEAVRAF